MLSPELIKKIKKIHITSGRMVDSMMSGQYRSVFRGAGVEFEEVREYAPGDDVKHIDWKVSARMRRPYVKLYREERELVLMLLVDMSGSTGFGTTDSIKRETAAEVASVLAFNAIRNNDKVGLILFTDTVERFIPPKKGAAHVWRVIKEIVSFAPQSLGTNVGAAADFLGKVARKRGVAFVISDFLDAEYISPLKRAARRHDVIAAPVTDPGDFTLPKAGILEVEDLETGARALLDCADKTTRQTYETARKAQYQAALQDFKRAGLDYIELSTQGATIEALHAFFRYRERRAR